MHIPYQTIAQSRINVSLNHRIVKVGKDFWRLSGPTLLFKQGHPDQVAQDRVLASKPDLSEGDVFAEFSEFFWEHGVYICFLSIV